MPHGNFLSTTLSNWAVLSSSQALVFIMVYYIYVPAAVRPLFSDLEQSCLYRQYLCICMTLPQTHEFLHGMVLQIISEWFFKLFLNGSSNFKVQDNFAKCTGVLWTPFYPQIYFSNPARLSSYCTSILTALHPMGCYMDLKWEMSMLFWRHLLAYPSVCNTYWLTLQPAGITKSRMTMKRVAEAEPIVIGEPELVDWVQFQVKQVNIWKRRLSIDWIEKQTVSYQLRFAII